MSGPAQNRRTSMMAEVYTSTQAELYPAAFIGSSISEVIQPLVPSSVVACGIMMIMRNASSSRPKDLVITANATTTTPVSTQLTIDDQPNTWPSCAITNPKPT